MFVKQLLHCTGLSAQRVQLKLGWTPQKSHASWCCHMISIYFSCRLYQLCEFSNMFPHACHECFQRPNPARRRVWKSRKCWAWDKARSACWSFNSSIVQANGRGYLICRWILDIKDSQPKNPTSSSIKSHADPSEIQHTSTFNHSSYYDVHDSHLSNGRPLDVKSQVLLCLCPAFGLPNFSADLHSQQWTWETSGTSRPQNAPQTEPHVRGVANLLDSVFALEPLP